MSNFQTQTSDIQSAHGIDHTWSERTGLPEWLGWLLNHSLAMLEVGREKDKQDARQLRYAIIASARENHLGETHKEMADRLLDILKKTLKQHVPNTSGLGDIITEIVTFRDRQSRGKRVTSHQWKLLHARLRHARLLAGQVEPSHHRQCLAYALAALSHAAEEETPSTMANLLRDTINAIACVLKCHWESMYAIQVQYLLKLSEHHPRKAGDKPLPPTAVNLLEKLGTYTR